MHVNAKRNDYQECYPNFDATPKAIIAAVALSLALRLTEDNFYEARQLLRAEWLQLWESGIVPNRPPELD